MKMNLGFLKPKQRLTPPGLCLLTDAAESEAILRTWQQELMTNLSTSASPSSPEVTPREGERA